MLLGCLTFGGAISLALGAGFNDPLRMHDREVAATVGFAIYPALFLVVRARVDYRAKWMSAISIAMLGAGLNALLLFVTVPAGVMLGLLSFGLVGRTGENVTVWLVIGAAGAVHGFTIASVERMIRFEKTPAHLFWWSGLTVGAAACAMFELMIDRDIGSNILTLGFLGGLAILPHLALIPAVNLDAAPV